MQSIISYVRSLLNWPIEGSTNELKRDRSNEDFSSDDDLPDLKRFKGSRAHRNMEVKEINCKKPVGKVRYIPIQVDQDHPSTSTPIDPPQSQQKKSIANFKKYFMVPRQLSQDNSDDDVTFVSSQQNKENVGKRYTRDFIDLDEYENGHKNEDDDDVIVLGKVPNSSPVTYYRIKDDSKKHNRVERNHIETNMKDISDKMKMYSLGHKFKGQFSNGNLSTLERRPSNIENIPKHEIIELDEVDHEQKEDDVIYIEQANTPHPTKHYKFFTSKNNNLGFMKLNAKVNENVDPKYKFKSPVGITKSYKRQTIPLSKWITNPTKTTIQRDSGLNGNNLLKVFNLDAKKNYRELINKMIETTTPVMVRANESPLKGIQRVQKASQKEIRETENVLKNTPYNKSSIRANEFDPITVAALNLGDSDVEVIPSETSSSSIKVDPVNSLKDSFKDLAVIRHDYIAEIDSKYRKKKQLTQEKAKELSIESQIRSKVNFEHRHLQMEQKLKIECCIPESLIKEPTPLLELPKLTAEQEKLVNKALGTGPPGQLLVEKFNLRIHRRDLQTLCGLNWLNDEVINFYMNLIQQRSTERPNLPRVYATNTFFYSKLMQSGQQGLRRWTKKVDIFAHDLIVVPVHLGVHWCLSLVDFKRKQISYLDSMGSPNTACLRALRQYLRDEHQDKKGEPFDDSEWSAECLKDIPQQMNGSDCGMFACTFAEFAARGAPFAFTQAHMPQLRRKMALEILQGKLML